MILQMFSLTGKVAIVTGAGRSIGKGIALAFAEAGADVACVARTTSEIEAVSEEIRGLGRKSVAITCDVREAEQVENMVKTAFEEFGRIDILVNNAGGGYLKPAIDTSQRAWETQISLNLTSAFLCSKAAARIMLEQKSGVIINISSRAGDQPAVGMIGYGVSKAGMNHLTRTLAFELAPHIRVNCISPGAVWTETSAETLGPAKDRIVRGTPLQRMGTPEDIAHAALYLASPASSWVTGKILEVDGGIYGQIFKPG